MTETAQYLAVRPWDGFDSTAAYTNLTPLIKLGGIKWSRNDVEASSAGRTQDSFMHRARVGGNGGIKIRLDCTSIAGLTTTQARTLLRAIRPVWLEVVYLDPMFSAADTAANGGDPNGYTDANGYRHARMYSNNVPATFLFMREKMNGNNVIYRESLWEGVDFPLIER